MTVRPELGEPLIAGSGQAGYSGGDGPGEHAGRVEDGDIAPGADHGGDDVVSLRQMRRARDVAGHSPGPHRINRGAEQLALKLRQLGDVRRNLPPARLWTT